MRFLSFLLAGILAMPLSADECPPSDTTVQTSPQDLWTIASWNRWGGVEAVSWNIKTFPQSGQATIAGVAEVMLDLGADIYAVQEINTPSALTGDLMPLLDGYDVVLGSGSAYALGVIYRTDVLSVSGTQQLWASTANSDDGDLDYEDNALWYFAGRPPLRVDFAWACGSATEGFSVINVHFKCCDDGLERRRIAAGLLHGYLDDQIAMGDTNWIVLGDWNNDLEAPAADHPLTVFLEDSVGFRFVTYDLAQDPGDYHDSYPTWPSFIDHLLIDQALFDDDDGVSAATFRLDDSIANYSSLLSDHRPVGWRFMVPSATPDVVINEIMQNPAAVSDSNGEWFEVVNNGATPVNLCGWTVKDSGTDDFVIDCSADSLILAQGAYAVFCRNGDTAANGGVTADFDYSDFTLGNGADEVILLDAAGLEVDRVEYDGGQLFPNPTGASMALNAPSLDNTLGTNWSVATAPYGLGDFGTPGVPNEGLAVHETSPLPSEVALHPNWPNPFNASTALAFELPERTPVRLSVVDLAGREVAVLAEGIRETGRHAVSWRPENSPSGVYLCRLEGPFGQRTAKLLLLK